MSLKNSCADEVYKIACTVTNKKSCTAVKKVAGIFWHLQLHNAFLCKQGCCRWRQHSQVQKVVGRQFAQFTWSCQTCTKLLCKLIDRVREPLSLLWESERRHSWRFSFRFPARTWRSPVCGLLTYVAHAWRERSACWACDRATSSDKYPSIMHHHPMSLPLEHYQKLTNLIRDIIIEGLGKYNITLLLNCSGAECQSLTPDVTANLFFLK